MRTELRTAAGLHVSLRPTSAEDSGFLHSLYADRRAPELPALGWPPDALQAFVDMQFAAQQSGYAAAFPAADDRVVIVGGEPVGRILVDRNVDEHRVVDVVVASAHQRRGIGTALMREVMADAAAAGVPVRLSALAHDQGLVSWYRRLGFVVAGDHGLSRLLEWSHDGLARFRLMVLSDTGLQDALLAVPDRRQFVARVVEEASARDCDVSPGDVEEALRTSWRVWNQRWI